jgi:hypothetical protein
MVVALGGGKFVTESVAESLEGLVATGYLVAAMLDRDSDDPEEFLDLPVNQVWQNFVYGLNPLMRHFIGLQDELEVVGLASWAPIELLLEAASAAGAFRGLSGSRRRKKVESAAVYAVVAGFTLWWVTTTIGPRQVTGFNEPVVEECKIADPEARVLAAEGAQKMAEVSRRYDTTAE